MNPKFLIGEKVARIMDGAEGTVKEISHFLDEWSYKVDLGREPLPGQEDDLWWGTETAWRPVFTLPAHVSTRSRDCDGEYLHEHTARANSLERTEQFGDLAFKERVMGNTVSFHSDGILTVAPHGLYWNQPTDEGYTATSVVWCEEDDCNDKPVYRDFAAERAGY